MNEIFLASSSHLTPMFLARLWSKAQNCPTIATINDNACFGCTKIPTQSSKKSWELHTSQTTYIKEVINTSTKRLCKMRGSGQLRLSVDGLQKDKVSMFAFHYVNVDQSATSWW